MTTKFKVGDRVRLKAGHKESAKSNGITSDILTIKYFDPGALPSLETAVFNEGGCCFTSRLELVPPAVTIDPAKRYKTRDGREVRIYATDGAGDEPVHGAYRENDEWWDATWSASGAYYGDEPDPHDLIEVKPEISGWVNVNRPNLWNSGQPCAHFYATKSTADAMASLDRIACIQITVTEGEGLEGGK